MKYTMIDKTNWTPVNLAWLAGLIEGEGCIGKNRAFLRIRMKDQDVIQHCMIFKIGHLRGPVEGNPEKKHAPMYEWTVTRMQHFCEIIRAIYPFLGSRRRQRIINCFESINESVMS